MKKRAMLVIAFIAWLLCASIIWSADSPPQAKNILLKSREISPDPRGAAAQKISTQGIIQEKYRIIQFDHIVSEEEKARLEEEGIHLLAYIPENAWYAKVSRKRSSFSSRYMTYIGDIYPEDKFQSGLIEQLRSECRVKDCRIPLQITFFSDVDENYARQIAQKHGLVVKQESSTIWIINATLPDIDSLLAENAIYWVEPAFKKKITLNNGARGAVSVDAAQFSPFNLNGSGIVIAEWDAGWAEQGHGDLAGRVRIGDNSTTGNLTCNDGTCNGNGACGFCDHGTHVAGTMMGSGANQAGTYRGMAPNATLLTYEWPDTQTELLAEFSQALMNNSVLSQNSWGYSNCSLYAGYYDDWSSYYDQIVRGENAVREVNIIFSAGNNGAGGGGCSAGYNTTVGPGGTAKNTITVGNIYSDTYVIVDSSSRGPTDDGRIKPDLVAPGDESGGDGGITSTITNNDYGVLSGTSMASPVVSGTIALMHEQYRRLHPSTTLDPSLVKAILIHTAGDLGNAGPDYIYGWGVVNASRAITYIMNDTNHSLFFANNITSNGGSVNYTFEYPAGKPELRISLAWNDYPGTVSASRHLINNLDLIVLNSTGERLYPWTLDRTNPATAAVRTQADDRNNVEQVYLANPPAGAYTAIVNGTTVPQPSQEYALVTNVNDEVAPGWSSNATNATTASPNSNIQFNISWSDGKALSSYIFSWNASGAWVNSTGLISGKAVNITINQSVTASNGTVIAWRFYANDSLNNINGTGIFIIPVISDDIIQSISSLSLSSSDNLNRTNGTISSSFTITGSNESFWYNGSTLFPHVVNSSILPANYTEKNQNWTFSVRAFSGANSTAWQNKTILIRNAAPEITPIAAGTINESEQVNRTITASDIDNEVLNYTINSSSFSLENLTFIWNTTVNDSGGHTFRVTVNDSESSANSTFSVTILNAADSDSDGTPDYRDADDDNDGISDTLDNVLGNATSLNTSIASVAIRVNGSTNFTASYNGTAVINISNGTKTVIEFNWTFSVESRLNLFNITVLKQGQNASNASIIVKGIELVNRTKTVYLDRISAIGYVCIKDAQIDSADEISAGCNGTREFFLQCNGILSNAYACNITDNGTSYVVSGLNHSGVREQCQDGDGDGYGTGCSPGSDCNDANPALAASCGGSSSSSSSSGGGGGGGGGGGAAPSTSTNFTDGKISFVGAIGDTLRYMLSGNSHSVKIDALRSNEATLIVKSLFIKTTLKLGETKRFDVDGNGKEDISIKLTKIENQKASLTISLLGYRAPLAVNSTVQANTTEQPPIIQQQVQNETLAVPEAGDAPKDERGGNLAWYLIGAAVCALLAIAILLPRLRKKREFENFIRNHSQRKE